MDYHYKINQLEYQIKARRFNIPLTVLIIFFMSFLFYYYDSDNKIFTFLAVAFINTFLWLLVYYYISPYLLKKSILINIIAHLGYLFLSVGLHYILFDKNILKYPSFQNDPSVPLQFKISFFFLISLNVFYAARSIFLITNTYKISIDHLKDVTHASQIEIDLLRQQMNPHFLFNALNNLNVLIRNGDTEVALQYNAEISSLLNNHLMHIESNSITIEQEIEWLENYLRIEQKRLPGIFKYSIQVEDEDLYQQSIPPMLLQPLLENSIIHGFTFFDKEKKGLITISVIELNANTISIIIEDNGAGINAERSETRNRKPLALYNIEKRIKLINEIGNFRIKLNKKIDEAGSICEIIIRDNSMQ